MDTLSDKPTWSGGTDEEVNVRYVERDFRGDVERWHGRFGGQLGMLVVTGAAQVLAGPDAWCKLVGRWAQWPYAGEAKCQSYGHRYQRDCEAFAFFTTCDPMNGVVCEKHKCRCSKPLMVRAPVLRAEEVRP